MDDRNFAMIWQLMQGMGANNNEGQANMAGPPTFENSLLSLKPLLSPKQQRVIDLMIKMQEVKALIDEIQFHH